MKQENEKQEDVKRAAKDVTALTELMGIKHVLEHDLCLLTQTLSDNHIKIIRVLTAGGMEKYLKVDYLKIERLL